MNPNTCPIGRVCTFQLGSEFYCQEDTSVNGGGSAGTAGGTSGTGGGRPSGGVGGGAAGGGNVNVNNMGCTCQSVDPSLALFALAGLIVRARWRRR
jgi:MYXO-CTERM domain-containing protein